MDSAFFSVPGVFSGTFLFGRQLMTVAAAAYKKRLNIRPYLFVLPALVLAVLFVYYPFAKTFLEAFSLVNAQGDLLGYTGLYNFRYLFGRRQFLSALGNTLLLTGINVPVTVIVSLSLAALATKKSRVSPLIETLFSIPMAVSMATAALVFKLMFNPTVGIVNRILGTEAGWFEDKGMALYTMLLLTVWMGIGFNFLLFLSALRSVPEDRMGAARVDGANEWQVLWHVRLPAVMPTTVYVCASNAILALMTSGPVMIITQGGPSRATTTLIYMMYTSGYASGNDALAACVSLVAFVLAFLFTWLILFLDREKVRDL